MSSVDIRFISMGELLWTGCKHSAMLGRVQVTFGVNAAGGRQQVGAKFAFWMNYCCDQWSASSAFILACCVLKVHQIMVNLCVDSVIFTAQRGQTQELLRWIPPQLWCPWVGQVWNNPCVAPLKSNTGVMNLQRSMSHMDPLCTKKIFFTAKLRKH